MLPNEGIAVGEAKSKGSGSVFTESETLELKKSTSKLDDKPTAMFEKMGRHGITTFRRTNAPKRPEKTMMKTMVKTSMKTRVKISPAKPEEDVVKTWSKRGVSTRMPDATPIATFYSSGPFVAAARAYSPSRILLVIAKDSDKEDPDYGKNILTKIRCRGNEIAFRVIKNNTDRVKN